MRRYMVAAVAAVVFVISIAVIGYYGALIVRNNEMEKQIEINILANETNFNITITIYNKGNETIPAPNWAYTYVLTYSNGTKIELYRKPSNWTSMSIGPGGKWTHTDNLHAFLEVKSGKRLLKLPPGKFKLFARYKSPNNPYSPKLPYEETYSNYLILEGKQPLKAFNTNNTPEIDGKIGLEEWDDANVHHLSWVGGPYSHVANNTVNVTLCLKHDAKYLYVLFTITGIEANDNEELRIITGDYELYLRQDEGFIQIPSGDVKGDAGFSYITNNKTYIFEIKLEINTYFTMGEISPFNIIFVKEPELNWAIVPVGGWNDGEPGILLL